MTAVLILGGGFALFLVGAVITGRAIDKDGPGHDAPRRACALPRAWGTWARRHAQAVRRRARTTVWADRNAGRFDSALGSPATGHAPAGAAGLPTLAEPSRLATPAERDWWLDPSEQAAAGAGLSRLKVFIEACTPQGMAGEIAATRPWNDDTGSFTAYIDAGEPA